MSEYITINTEQNLVSQFRIDPLPVYTESYSMLKEVMPEFDVSKLPNESVGKLIQRMKMTMKLYSGIGLSANQCGVRARIFVIGTDEMSFVCINPKIIQGFGNKQKLPEGCLSSPGLYVNIPRYESVEVEFHNEDGELVRTIMDGVTAQCFQHELDHLNGVYFTQLAGETSLMMARKKQQKLIKHIKRTK